MAEVIMIVKGIRILICVKLKVHDYVSRSERRTKLQNEDLQ